MSKLPSFKKVIILYGESSRFTFITHSSITYKNNLQTVIVQKT